MAFILESGLRSGWYVKTIKGELSLEGPPARQFAVNYLLQHFGSTLFQTDSVSSYNVAKLRKHFLA